MPADQDRAGIRKCLNGAFSDVQLSQNSSIMDLNGQGTWKHHDDM